MLDSDYTRRMSSDTTHRSSFAEQAEHLVRSGFATPLLPDVILSTTRSHGRGPSRARIPPPSPAYPRREVEIIDGTEFAPADGRYLAFCGRCYGPGTPRQDRGSVRVVIGVLARMFTHQPVVDTTATEVR